MRWGKHERKEGKSAIEREREGGRNRGLLFGTTIANVSLIS